MTRKIHILGFEVSGDGDITVQYRDIGDFRHGKTTQIAADHPVTVEDLIAAIQEAETALNKVRENAKDILILEGQEVELP